MYAAEFGCPVFPCFEMRGGKCACRKGSACPHPGKHPRWEEGTLEHGFNDATTDTDQIHKWSERWPTTNWALRTGGYLRKYGGYFFALDIDPRHGGDKWLEAYEAEHGPLPSQQHVRSGGGGDHFLMLSPVPVGKLKLADGVEVQGQGAYIIAAGSNHISGRRYELIGGLSTESLERAPEPLLQMINDTQSEILAGAGAERTTTNWTKTAEGWQASDGKTGEVRGVLTDLTQRLTNPKLDAMVLKRQLKRATESAKKRRPKSRGQASNKAVSGRSRDLAGCSSQAIGNPILSVKLPDPAPEIADYPPESGLLCPLTGVGKRVWAAARRCLVTDYGQTNDKFPALACSLKNIPALRGLRAKDLKPVVHWWYKESVASMKAKRWDAVWKRWEYLWNKWSKPGIGIAWRAAARLAGRGCHQDLSGYEFLRLLCEEIQQEALQKAQRANQWKKKAIEWFLSCRTAADVLASLGFEVSHTTAATWLKQLVEEGLLVKPSEHKRGSLYAQRFMTAEAKAQCEQPDRGKLDTQRRLPVTGSSISSIAFRNMTLEGAASSRPDPFASSPSTSRRPLLLDFGRCWATQSIHGPLPSWSFSLN